MGADPTTCAHAAASQLATLSSGYHQNPDTGGSVYQLHVPFIPLSPSVGGNLAFPGPLWMMAWQGCAISHTSHFWDVCLRISSPPHGNSDPAVGVSEIELCTFLRAPAQQIQGLPGPWVRADNSGGRRRWETWTSQPLLIFHGEPRGAVASPGGAGWAAGSAHGTKCTDGLGAGRSERGTTGVLCASLATLCLRFRQFQIIWFRAKRKTWATSSLSRWRVQLLRGANRAWARESGQGEASVPQPSGRESWASEGTLLSLSALGSTMR